MSLLITHARLITVPAGTEDAGYIEDGWMLVEDGRIAALGSGAPTVTADEVLDVDGAFVAPGFVSSHSHLFTSGLRGLGVGETLYGWCDSMLGMTSAATPEDVYWSTLHGALDFLGNGVTTAYNFTDPLQAWESMVDGKRVGVADKYASFDAPLTAEQASAGTITLRIKSGSKRALEIKPNGKSGARSRLTPTAIASLSPVGAATFN